MKSLTPTLTFVLVLVATAVVVAQDEGGGRLRLAPGEIKAPEAATTQAGTAGVAGLQMGVLRKGSPRRQRESPSHADSNHGFGCGCT